MKTQKILILIGLIVLTSCTPATPGPTSTEEYTKPATPTSTAGIPPIIVHDSMTGTPSPTAITATSSPIAIAGAPSIRDMALDQAGYLWIATSDDMIRWNTETGQYTRCQYNKELLDSERDGIENIAINSDGNIVVLTHFGGVMELTNGNWATIIEAENHNVLGGSINTQNNGTLWISLGYSGAYQYIGKSLRHIRTPEQFDCGFSSLLEGNGELWAADGICYKQPPILRKYDDANWILIEGYYPDKFVSDRQGNIWFWGYEVGIVRADLTEKIDPPAKGYFSPSDFEFAPDGSLWLVSYWNGVYHFSNGQWESIDIGYEIDNITSMVIGEDGSVYIGTDGFGMFRFANSKWSQYLFIQ